MSEPREHMCLVLVCWHDAVEKDWGYIEDKETLPRPAARLSLGFYVGEDTFGGRRYCVLAQTWTPANGMVAHLLAIPAGCIISIACICEKLAGGKTEGFAEDKEGGNSHGG